MPTTEEITVREQVINTARAVLPRRAADNTYKYEIKKYKDWAGKLDSVKNGGKYLTRDNVDLYFTDVQKDRLVTVNTGRRVVSALQFFADTDEYAGDAVGFRVESNVVLQMLMEQRQSKTQHELETGKDYHIKLTVKNMTYIEKSQIVRYVLKTDKSFWSDFMTAWNACNAMFCRVDTIKKMRLNDIFVDKGHSVNSVKQDVDNRFDDKMIGLILRPHVHKERSSVTHVIGAYRHRDPYMCFTGCLAMNLFVLLNTELTTEEKFNFYDTQANIDNNILTEKERCKNRNYVEPDWSKISLIRGWNNQKAAYESYSQVLKSNNVEWEKVTHLRKSGIESASAAGLDAQSIGTMSKHHTERSKMNSCYFTELLPSVLLWASGFDKDDIHSYNNPRTRLAIPDECNNSIEDTIFPRLRVWRLELESKLTDERLADEKSRCGDNRACARSFLYEVLPLLALVIFQDGIYWIKDFPNSPPSRLLLSTMFPRYANWASDARRQIVEQVKSVGQVQIENLNATAQRAFNMMVAIQEHNRQQELANHRQVLEQFQRQQQLLEQMQVVQYQQYIQIQQIVQQQQRQTMHQNNAVNNAAGNTFHINGINENNDNDENDVVNNDNTIDNYEAERIINENNSIERIVDDNFNVERIVDDNYTVAANNTLAMPIPVATYQPPPARQINYNNDAIVPIFNVNNRLQAIPTVPFIPTALPQSLYELVEQHYEYKLDSFVHGSKSHWPTSVRVAYSKRKNLFEYIRNKASRVRGPDDIKTKTLSTATTMDREERGELSVDKFARLVCNNSVTRKKRNRRQPQSQPQPQQPPQQPLFQFVVHQAQQQRQQYMPYYGTIVPPPNNNSI